jgi:hypothetical protein
MMPTVSSATAPSPHVMAPDACRMSHALSYPLTATSIVAERNMPVTGRPHGVGNSVTSSSPTSGRA